MRRSLASLALIQRESAGQTLTLVQWNANWKRFSLVGGHKHDDETFRECLIRELAEELGLRGDTDLAVSEQPIIQTEYTCWSESARQDTSYEIELFDVAILTQSARQQVDGNPLNCWVSHTEILAGYCGAGRPIDGSAERLMRLAGVLVSHESTTAT